MFKSISFVTLMLLSASSAFAVLPRIDTLIIGQSEIGVAHGCTPELCVEITPLQTSCEGQACTADIADGMGLILKLSGGRDNPAQMPYQLTGLSSTGEDSSFKLWPKLIRFEGGVLAGVETRVNAMYSGGGATSTTLHLIAFLAGQPPFEVLHVPQSANMMIRACFSERDVKQRAGACHDEYNFDTNFTLTGTSAAGMPVLRYRSKATSFPGPVSRSRDSLAGRPLRKRDIVTVTDPQCSYQRLYRFVPKARGYVADTPPPDCSDYTVP